MIINSSQVVETKDEYKNIKINQTSGKFIILLLFMWKIHSLFFPLDHFILNLNPRMSFSYIFPSRDRINHVSENEIILQI